MPTIYERDCEHCGRSYRGTGKRFCSDLCRTTASSRRVNLVCKGCGLSYSRPASCRKYTAAQFCSPVCWYKFAKGKELTCPGGRKWATCQQCRKPFRTLKSLTRHFCSWACTVEWRNANPSPKRISRIECQCVTCGKAFQRLACQIQAGRGRTCSKTCRAILSNTRQLTKRSSSIEQRFFGDCVSAGARLTLHHHIGRYVLDAITLDGSTAFEFDGTYWHSSKEAIARDQRKDAYLKNLGIRVVRIPESLYKLKPAEAVSRVLAAQMSP